MDCQWSEGIVCGTYGTGTDRTGRNFFFFFVSVMIRGLLLSCKFNC